MANQDKIVEEAKRWVTDKVKWTHNSSSKKGCDCGGFVIGVINAVHGCNIKLPYYPKDWCLHKGKCEENRPLMSTLHKYFKRIDNDKREAGDFIMFKQGRYNNHIVIYLGGELFAHSEEGVGCRYGIIKKSQWEKALSGVFRFDETTV